MDKFEISSNKEREMMEIVFRKMKITDYDFTPSDGDDRHDGTFNSGTHKIMFEVKVRNIYQHEHKDTVIETSKYEYMQKASKNIGAVPMLFIFFKGERFLLECLNKTYKTKKMKAPRTTSDTKRSNMVTKNFILIPITEDNTYNLY